MTLSYYCPHCGGVLNPGGKVIFIVDQEAGSGFLLLSPDLGDYTVLAGSASVAPGTVYTLRCSVCRRDLVSPVDNRLVEILCRDEDGSETRVNFSRVAGEHATFVCESGEVHTYGDDADRYAGLNFFGAGKHGSHESP